MATTKRGVIHSVQDRRPVVVVINNSSDVINTFIHLWGMLCAMLAARVADLNSDNNEPMESR